MAKLKPVLKTRKLNSLPSELKLIAEELILEKFGDDAVVPRKEKKVVKSTSSFQRYSKQDPRDYQFGIDMGLRFDEAAFAGFAESFSQSNVSTFTRSEPGVDRRVDYESRSMYFATPIVNPSTRAFRDSIQRLDYENAPRHKRKATVSPGFARELMSHPDFPQFAAFREDRYRGYREGHYIGELFGVPIFAVEGVHAEITAQ